MAWKERMRRRVLESPPPDMAHLPFGGMPGQRPYDPNRSAKLRVATVIGALVVVALLVAAYLL
jgi:hypothetical protein